MEYGLLYEDPYGTTIDYSNSRTDTVDDGFNMDSSKRNSTFQNNASNLNPNMLMEVGKRPQSIIYTGRLFVDPDISGRSHAAFYLRGNNEGLIASLGRFLPADPNKQADEWKQQWRALYSKFLFGRMAWLEKRQVLAFWGLGSDSGFEDIKGPQHMVQPALRALHSNDYINDDTTVILGDGSVGKAGDLIMGKQAKKADPEAAKKIELAKRMHLAGGAEKKRIMNQLGVGGGGSKKRDSWDAALQGLGSGGGLSPGHSKWRMSSEQHERILNSVLFDL